VYRTARRGVRTGHQFPRKESAKGLPRSYLQRFPYTNVMRKKTLEWMLAGVLLSAPGVVKGGPSGRELLVNANTLRDQGLVMQVETAYRQALSAAERTGAPLGEIAIILNNLGQVLRALGRYGEAEPVLVRSLEIKRQTVGGRDADVAITLNNLA
jgi:hypothetical protein